MQKMIKQKIKDRTIIYIIQYSTDKSISMERHTANTKKDIASFIKGDKSIIVYSLEKQEIITYDV